MGSTSRSISSSFGRAARPSPPISGTGSSAEVRGRTVRPQKEDIVSSEAAREILVRGARAIARSDPGQGLDDLLAVIAEQLDVESAGIVVLDAPEPLRIGASTRPAEPALAGLAEALRNPPHPIPGTPRDP